MISALSDIKSSIGPQGRNLPANPGELKSTSNRSQQGPIPLTSLVFSSGVAISPAYWTIISVRIRARLAAGAWRWPRSETSCNWRRFIVTLPRKRGAERRVSADETELKTLMVRGLSGDGGAHGQLLRQMAGHLRAYYGRRLGTGSAEVEDLVQETLLAIHLKRATFDRSQLFTPWAYAIARYKLLDHFRRTGRRPTTPLEDTAELIADSNPEEGAVRRDIESLLGALPERQQALMRDVKILGLSMEEAGEKHGMSSGAVKVAVHRAMKQLKSSVTDEDG